MGKNQLHKRLNEYQVRDILQKYLNGMIGAKQACIYLGVGRTRFYELVATFKMGKEDPIVRYARHTPNNRLSTDVTSHILKELQIEKKIVTNPSIPTKRYNYSYVRGILEDKYGNPPSLSTIIAVAKKHGYYKPKVKHENKHDRQVITNFVGELVQHDSSHHLFAPDAHLKWYLITSLDDFSRRILYGNLFEEETSWAHIQSVENVCTTIGIPFAYYADQHRIFRFVKDRDKPRIHNEYTTFTDEVDPQWRQVLKDLSIDPRNALSPQAKGKVERPYGWLQDHLVRTCVREGVTTIADARSILYQEIYAYNNKRVHSTTGEIPMIRFNRAVKEGKTLLRPFSLPAPYLSTKDIFCLRLRRMTDGYRTVSVKGTKLKVPNGECYVQVELRMYPNLNNKTVEVRFWQDKKFLGSTMLSLETIPIVRF